MADRARSTFMTLKSKRQRTEDDEDDFLFVKVPKEKVIQIMYLKGDVAILDSKNERKPKARDKPRDTGIVVG